MAKETKVIRSYYTNEKIVTETPIKNNNPINEQQKTKKWILCSKRLPNEKECLENMNVFLVSNGKKAYIRLFDYKNKVFYHVDIGNIVNNIVVENDIIKWMPLPRL